MLVPHVLKKEAQLQERLGPSQFPSFISKCSIDESLICEKCNTFICVYIYILCMYVCTCLYTYVFVYVCVYIYIYVHTYLVYMFSQFQAKASIPGDRSSGSLKEAASWIFPLGGL